jgi:hypothetical protein
MHPLYALNFLAHGGWKNELFILKRLVKDLAALCSAGQNSLRLVQHYMKSNAYQVFSPLGPNSLDFHQLLQLSKSIVAGPAALLALMPGSFTANSMDIYTPYGKAAELVHGIQHCSDYWPIAGPHTNLFRDAEKNLYGYCTFISKSTGKIINVYVATTYSPFYLGLIPVNSSHELYHL